MPANIPTAAKKDGEAEESVGHGTSRTTAQRKTVSRDSLPGDNNQEKLSSVRMEINQRPNPNGRKRTRSEDDEDELAWSVRQNRTRTSAMPGLENWEAFTMRQLAQRDPEVLCAMLNAARAENRRQRTQINSLEAEIKQEKKSHEGKRFKLNNELKALRTKVEKLLLEKMDFGTMKTSDNTIKSMWWKLSYKIKNVVSNYFTEWPQGEVISIDGIEDDQQAQFISADQIVVLRQSIRRRQMWNILFYNIFSGNGDNCHGEISQVLARLCAKQGPDSLPSPQYLQMISKIKSALDLDLEKEGVPNSRDNPEQLIQRTVVHFKDLVVDKKLDEFEVDMREIFSEAWKIHTATMASRAIFIVQWPRDGNGNNDCPYDPETMEFFDNDDTTSASERTVRVVESPVLWKIGNGDGENFDSTMVLCKHCVFPGERQDEPSTCTLDESSS